MKKLIKIIVILAIVLFALFQIIKTTLHVEVDEASLPQTVYQDDSNFLTIINTNLMKIFVLDSGDEYTATEEIMNYVILDSIREKVNEEYSPLADCETDECNYIIKEDNYYVNYLYAELTESNQLLINISFGTDNIIYFNTIAKVYMDIEFDYTNLEIILTLSEVTLNNIVIEEDTLDRIIGYLDQEEIEGSITEGTLDLDDYTYRIDLNPFN